jgi:diguanylate cyclase (GGDEF)-like protein
LVLLFIALWVMMLAARLTLPTGFLVTLVVEAGTLVVYGWLVHRAKSALTLDWLHYTLLAVEIGFHSAMVYYLGGLSWLGAIAYVYAILYAGAFLSRWQTALFTASVAAVSITGMSLEAVGVVPHQSFLPEGADRYQDPRFVATSAIMFVGVLGTIAFWVAWLGSEVRRERDEAIKANAELLRAQGEFQRLNEELEQKVEERTRALLVRAEVDQLTGLLNRWAVTRRCKDFLLLAARGGRPMVVVMADVDDFKSCNDEGGHQYGDRVLQALALTLRGSTRASDIVGRMGGDEFLVVLPDTTLPGAIYFCRRVSDRIEKWRLECEGDCPVPTVSLGVGVFPDHGSEMEEIIRVADRAMYDAKADGGGRWKVGAPGSTFSRGQASRIAKARGPAGAKAP